MKNLFKNKLSLGVLTLLMGVLLSSCGKFDKIDGVEALPDPSSSSRADNCEMIISGKVVNTKNLLPIAGAVVSGEQFTVKTNADGEFSTTINLTEGDVVDDIKVTGNGFVDKEFKAYLSSVAPLASCPLITNISWDIALSAKREAVGVGPKDGAWYKIMDTIATRINQTDLVLIAKTFTIDIRRGSFSSPAAVIISPDNSRAIGPGIPSDPNNFLLQNFDIEVQGGENLTGAASSRNSIDFLKDIDIRWTPPVAFDPATTESIDLEDLGIGEETVALGPDGEIVFLVGQDGMQAIGFEAIVKEVVAPLIMAIQAEAPLDEIQETVAAGLATANAGTTGGGETAIATDVESNGRLANEESFSNCDCGDPSLASFSAQLTGTESINIDFPAGTSEAEQADAFAQLRGLIGASGSPDQSVALNVSLDKCQVKTITAREILRTVTGTVAGYSFSYVATDRLETTEAVSACATTTPCHQGCPG